MSEFALVLALLAASLRPADPPSVPTPEPVRGRQDLRVVAEKVAADVRILLQEKRLPAVRVGRFAAAQLPDGTGGAAIEHELRTVLADVLNPKSPVEVHGTFAYAAEPQVEGRVVRVTATIDDLLTGEVLKKIDPIPLLYVHDIGRFTGPNGIIAPLGSSGEARQKLDEIVTKPTPEIDAAGRVWPRKDSRFAVEVRAVKDGKSTPLVPTVEDGRPVVKLAPGDEYEVRILNNAPEEAAFRLSVDGLDQFAFAAEQTKDRRPAFTHQVLPGAKGGKPGEVVVRGWLKKLTGAGGPEVEAFRASAVPGGATAQGKFGLIAVAFCESFPADQPRATADLAAAVGTNRAAVQRNIDPVTEFVTIRFAR